MANNNTISIDSELQYLVDLSGLKEEFIAKQNEITPQYFSMLKTSARSGNEKRLAVKQWLVQFIQHNINFRMAA